MFLYDWKIIEAKLICLFENFRQREKERTLVTDKSGLKSNILSENIEEEYKKIE